jgi:hypothetical protein
MLLNKKDLKAISLIINFTGTGIAIRLGGIPFGIRWSGLARHFENLAGDDP